MNKRQGRLNSVLLVWCLLTLGGCAQFAAPQFIPPVETSSWRPQSQARWHYLQFKIGWDQDTHPDWHLDALIGHHIIAPVVRQYASSIELWRFHRRAALDDTGHQFSFIFYVDPNIAEQIEQQILEHPVLIQLMEHDLITLVKNKNTSDASFELVSATSDSSWPLIIQQAWPHYIMGVSAFWLDLLDRQIQLTAPVEFRNLRELIAYYQVQHEAVNQLWQQHGQHALLHHLNALFAYQPLRIIEHRMQRY